MKQNKGFTLIEVMLVVVIIAILSTLGFTNYMKTMKRGRDGKRIADLAQIQGALEMYRMDVKSYPSDTDDLTDSGQEYIKQLPTDPNGTNNYDYVSDGNDYHLCACMELEGSAEDDLCYDDYDPSCTGGTYRCCTSRP